MAKVKRNSGYTIIEFMIGIAIVGIIAGIAIPRYTLHINKSKQSEAKINLSNLYSGEKVFYFDHGYYDPRLDAIGFKAEGQIAYRIGFAVDSAGYPSGATPLGTANCINTGSAACNGTLAYGASVPWIELSSATSAGSFSGDAVVSDPVPSTFKAEARGRLTGADDVLSISSSNKEIVNNPSNLQ